MTDCTKCHGEAEKHGKQMAVPFAAVEAAANRSLRREKRLFIVIIVLIVSLVACNMGWLYAWNQYDYVSAEQTTVDVDGSNGIANYLNGGGTINNGTDNSN